MSTTSHFSTWDATMDAYHASCAKKAKLVLELARLEEALAILEEPAPAKRTTKS